MNIPSMVLIAMITLVLLWVYAGVEARWEIRRKR